MELYISCKILSKVQNGLPCRRMDDLPYRHGLMLCDRNAVPLCKRAFHTAAHRHPFRIVPALPQQTVDGLPVIDPIAVLRIRASVKPTLIGSDHILRPVCVFQMQLRYHLIFTAVNAGCIGKAKTPFIPAISQLHAEGVVLPDLVRHVIGLVLDFCVVVTEIRSQSLIPYFLSVQCRRVHSNPGNIQPCVRHISPRGKCLFKYGMETVSRLRFDPASQPWLLPLRSLKISTFFTDCLFPIVSPDAYPHIVPGSAFQADLQLLARGIQSGSLFGTDDVLKPWILRGFNPHMIRFFCLCFRHQPCSADTVKRVTHRIRHSVDLYFADLHMFSPHIVCFIIHLL